MAPEIEAATALLQAWDGEVEELAWVAELLDAIGKKQIDREAVSELVSLAEDVCAKAGTGSEIGKLEAAISRARSP